jgi:hypothetical protein
MAIVYDILNIARQEFRLLRLDVGSSSRTPHFEMATFPLLKAPKFKALSYCWTNAPPNRRIFVNETPFYVRPNLYDFLLRMLEECAEFWIFVDAICIIQRSAHGSHELEEQVKLTGDIYRCAEEVLAWLGECGSDTSSEDLAFYQKTIERNMRIPDTANECGVVRFGSRDHDSLSALVRPLSQSKY